MQIRRLTIERFRGIQKLDLRPGARTVILGPQNAGKSTVLEALDLLLHPGLGRRRPDPTEIDYHKRDIEKGFEIEAVVGDLSKGYLAEVAPHLEGWKAERAELVTETEGAGVETVVRVRVRGAKELTYEHAFAKPESEGESFNPGRRAQLGWVFDGRTRDPLRQLAFFQGGLLERLFAEADLEPAVRELRDALKTGAQRLNADMEVTRILGELGGDLRRLGLLEATDLPSFEAGSVSKRELLQSLRLALPSGGDAIPLMRQGRGTQRLVLVSILLRIARAGAVGGLIGGFEEPEEALEPLRQAQLAGMLYDITEEGGQIFLVTHSPEIARRFEIDDFLLLSERTSGDPPRALRSDLSDPVRHTYERWLDGAVVRGLFSRVPVLVEGPGDRAVFECFWRHQVEAGTLRTAAELGVEVVNCEGAENMPMQAAVLKESGKKVVAWTEQDTEQVREVYSRLKSQASCGLIASHSRIRGHQNLEEALAQGCQLPSLVAGLRAIAEDRSYEWDKQREVLVSHLDGIDIEDGERDTCKAAGDIASFIAPVGELNARTLVGKALAAKGVTPFSIKGGRHARLFADAIIKSEGVPENFVNLLKEIDGWVRGGCTAGVEVWMSGG